MKIMKRLFFVLMGIILTAVVSLAVGIASVAQRQVASATQRLHRREREIVRSVRTVLDEQVKAWNRGDIESFMEGYARSPETVFVSGDTVIRGWQTVLDRYRKTYNSPEKMGRLQFSELEIHPVSHDAAIALGRWQLTRAGDAPRGRFTLVFRRIAGRWRIVHDHTSSASN